MFHCQCPPYEHMGCSVNYQHMQLLLRGELKTQTARQHPRAGWCIQVSWLPFIINFTQPKVTWKEETSTDQLPWLDSPVVTTEPNFLHPWLTWEGPAHHGQHHPNVGGPGLHKKAKPAECEPEKANKHVPFRFLHHFLPRLPSVMDKYRLKETLSP